MEFSKYALAGIATSLIAYSFYAKNYDNKIKQGSYFEKSVNLLKGYKPAIDVLGEPIETQRIETNHEFNELNKKVAKLIIPISGPKGNGHLYTWSTRLKDDSDWQVQQLDLEILKPKYKKTRWTFFYETTTDTYCAFLTRAEFSYINDSC